MTAAEFRQQLLAEGCKEGLAEVLLAAIDDLRVENERRFSQIREANARYREAQALARLRESDERHFAELRAAFARREEMLTKRVLYVGVGLAMLIIGLTAAGVAFFAAFS